MVVMTIAALWIERVTASVMTCFVCCVSVRTRASIWPVFVRVKNGSGRRWRCA